MAYIVAIDGTAGSGKGTVTKMVAEKLEMMNIDTGIIYRCITLAVIDSGIDYKEEVELEKLLQDMDISIKYDGKDQEAYLDKVNVTNRVRNKEVNELVSKISGIRIVREYANKIIREIAKYFLDQDISIIMEGRDITTVVFPNADFKFYLDASLDERVKRRLEQNKEKGIDMSESEIKDNIAKRDYNDMHKKVGALKKTDDQIYIDTSNMTIDEVVNKIVNIVKEGN